MHSTIYIYIYAVVVKNTTAGIRKQLEQEVGEIKIICFIKNLLLIGLSILFIGMISCQKNEIRTDKKAEVVSLRTSPWSIKIEFKLKHTSIGAPPGVRCNKFPGICLIITFEPWKALSSVNVSPDESTGFIKKDQNGIYIQPNKVCWNAIGVVPITESQYIPNGNFEILPGNYPVTFVQGEPRIYINYVEY